MAHVREGLKARASAQVFELRKKAARDSDPEEAERLMWKEMDERRKAAAELDLAIKKTVEFYGISPAGLQYGESQAARQGPMIGSAITWAPAVLDADHLSFQYTDADNKIRYDGSVGSPAGQTYENGQVTINIAMFEKAVMYDHPGSLAYVLHHEAQHFEEKVTRLETLGITYLQFRYTEA